MRCYTCGESHESWQPCADPVLYWLCRIEREDKGTTHFEGCERFHLRCAFVRLARENTALLTALHDAIRRPIGVVPESAEPFYDQNRADSR